MNPSNLFGTGPYEGYAYGYPHKTSYRAFDPPRRLHDLWAQEKVDALFLYAHVPFCFQRCSFCNLFTTVRGAPERQERFLVQLARQAHQIREALPEASFVSGAIGGGTPTWLDESGLERVFDVFEFLGAPLGEMPLSVECSPETMTPAKAHLLKRRGTHRASIGIQSFVDSEAKAIGRTQRGMTVQTALESLRAAEIPRLNIDLIYGLKGQSTATWQYSLESALEWRPEEVFLYPLFKRPLTGLDRQKGTWDDERMERYQHGRDFLLACGYRQVSMRMFEAPDAPVVRSRYQCQADGMVGLGPGARSYTESVHWSTRFAVGGTAVLNELDAWLNQESLDEVHWGTKVSKDDRMRRYVMQGLLQATGFHQQGFRDRYGIEVLDVLPELSELVAMELATCVDGHWALSPTGLAWSDAIGPWLYSDGVKQLMADWELR